ncbi:unnamed protein product [Darwinula stevensoni]|uniref:Dolichyl-diphosphooligosaccharide--protein glycosyltransferase subunit STT3A n=1 Tax=Darwinula stevensoni TaxID=69355 RepID=A0A7R8WZH6_9CRUS|nr:unnamed protein product [Darwinula stevensoni]CAG0880587.1 unnamed protein product [Darwinula stevensoni]
MPLTAGAKRPGDDLAVVSVPKRGKLDLVSSDQSTSVAATGPPRTSSLLSPIMLLTGHEADVFCGKFHPEGQFLVTAGYDRQLFFWNVYGECNNFAVLPGHSGAILEVQFSPDGNTLYSASTDKTIGMWDVQTGARLKKMKGHTSFVNSCGVARRGPPLIVSGSDDCTVKMWDSRRKGAILSLQCTYPVTAVSFNDTSDHIYSSGIDNDIKVWDLRKSSLTMRLRGHTDSVTGMSLSSDGNLLLTNSMDNTLRIWDIRPFAPADRMVKIFSGHAHSFEKNLLRCSWSPNGMQVAAGSADKFVHVWDVNSRRILYKLPGHTGSVNEVVFHPREPIPFASRLFSVLRFESVIHEFDPYFNYRTTWFLADEGFYKFHNWFDDRAWYPLGRIIGGTIYPGLMLTSTAIYHILHFLNVTIHIREICVFLAPVFSGLTTIVTYLLTKELKDSGAGLTAAVFIAIVPGYISRSVAGSYDNEGIAIFCMLLTYYLWIKSVKTGSLFWSVMAALAYFYMVSSWGGYVFLMNLIPIHVLALMVTGRFSQRIYVAYSVLYILGTILSMQIPFVGFQPVQSSEHLAAFGVFGLVQLHAFLDYVRSKLSKEQFSVLFRSLIMGVLALGGLFVMILSITGKISPWTGRFYSLLDPSYAKNNIPIIASVSEHQPTTWSSFYFDLQIMVFLFPVGIYFCFTKLTDANIFIILYGITAIYFAGVMVRLMLVLAPVMCILSGIAASSMLSNYVKNLDAIPSVSASEKKVKKGEGNYFMRTEIAYGFLGIMMVMFFTYTMHCTWVTSEAYSSPSIVLGARAHDGSRIIFDDFREAYYWLRQNTPEDAKVMSWWDYGYQITAMANRTILVDNNTWNNTHISRVGQAMASPEDKAYEIMRELDVDYVLVIFGGLTGYSSDDINKFLWMVRIGGSTDRGQHIKEWDYYTPQGEFRVDKEGSPKLLNCLMYKMSYYRFGSMYTEAGKPPGYDRVRNAEIGNKDFELDVLEEAYTTEHWIVRIYKVKDLPNRGV